MGVPFTLSAMGPSSIEHVKQVAPEGCDWFQLYMWKDRDRSIELVGRVPRAGFCNLVVIADVPVAGARLRHKRNGFAKPPALTMWTALIALPRPWVWFDFLTVEPLESASLSSGSGTVAEPLNHMFDPTVSNDDLKCIKKQWPEKY